MQLIGETLFPLRMSVTITVLTYSSYTSQSIAVVTTAPVYLFIARQSRNAPNLIGYISAISKPIHFWFSPKFSGVQGLQKLAITGSDPISGPISKFLTSTLKIGEGAL